jgi:type I restriction enzyme S subunit
MIENLNPVMNEWSECKLSDITTKIGDGLHGTPIYEPKGDYYFINGNNLYLGKIVIKSDTNRVSGEQAFKYSKPLSDKTILLSINGTIGNLALYNNEKCMLGKSACYINVDNKNSRRFLYYVFCNRDFQSFLTENATGTTIPNVPIKGLREYSFLIPPLPEQHAIASVLSSLDDKIDLLNRQNKTLESMAETLFRQWFIEEADEAWEEVELEYIASRITDGAHASPPSSEFGKPMASVKDMYDWGIDNSKCRLISEDDYNKLVRDDCRPLKNDILIAKDGSYLKHIFVVRDDLDVVILSSIAIIRPNGKYDPILLCILLKLDSTLDLLKNIVTGAVIPRIVLKDFRKFPIVLPPVDVQQRALVVIKPLITKCWKNDDQIRTLESLRDTLLPKLMSGEVRVQI